MTETITHGLANHNFMFVARPQQDYQGRVNFLNEPDFKKPIYNLKDPNTGELRITELHDILRFDVNHIPEYISRMAYGLPHKKLTVSLKKKFPNLITHPEVELLLLKRL